MALPPDTGTAVRAGGLRKRYGDVAALAGVDIGIVPQQACPAGAAELPAKAPVVRRNTAT